MLKRKHLKKMERRSAKMIDVKCSLCNKVMPTPASLFKNMANAKDITHLCSDCTSVKNRAKNLLDGKLESFIDAVNKQIEKLDKNNEIAEKLAKKITDSNAKALLDEFKFLKDISNEELILESFFRGAWTALFTLASNRKKGFLEKEAKKINDFYKKCIKREV